MNHSHCITVYTHTHVETHTHFLKEKCERPNITFHLKHSKPTKENKMSQHFLPERTSHSSAFDRPPSSDHTIKTRKLELLSCWLPSPPDTACAPRFRSSTSRCLNKRSAPLRNAVFTVSPVVMTSSSSLKASQTAAIWSAFCPRRLYLGNFSVSPFKDDTEHYCQEK